MRVDLVPGIFFGVTGGLGLARIDHPDLDSALRPGAIIDLAFGWHFARRWSVGGEFFTWETSATGTPVHLHTIGPILEFRPSGDEGPLVRGSAGLALTEGEGDVARAGGAAAIGVGYAWRFAWITLTAEAGVHGHAYENGSAVLPLVGVQLRFNGSTR